MNNEERDIIARFIARVGGATATGFGSVPGSAPTPLPAIDTEADSFIGQQFAQYPEARYRITQMAFVQEAALQQAQVRMRQLQWERDQAVQAAQAQPQGGRGFLGGLFGGGGRAAGPSYQPAPQPPPPPPQYAPGMAQPGMFQRGGSGFLGTALTTAAGVAGGMVAGNLLMDMFSGHHGGGLGGASGLGGFGGAAGPDAAGGVGGPDPWGGAGTTPDQADSLWSKDDVYNQSPGSAPSSDTGWGDAGQSGPGGQDSGGWDDAGGGGDDSWT